MTAMKQDVGEWWLLSSSQAFQGIMFSLIFCLLCDRLITLVRVLSLRLPNLTKEVCLAHGLKS